MTKKNPNLTAEQKLVMFEEGTERAGSSELNSEKREGSYHCANCDEKLFESKKNTRAALVGHHSSNLCLMYLKQKQITMLVTREQSITVRIAAVITDIFLMMVLNQQVKDIVIMVFV